MRDRGIELFHQWREMPRDMLSNCRACDENSHVYFHAYMEEDEEALRRARPLLDGELSCTSVPHSTITNVLDPLRRSGRGEEADLLQKRGYRMVSRDPRFLTRVAMHMNYLTRYDARDRSLRMFERHLGWNLQSNVPSDSYYFERAAFMLFERLAESGDRHRKLRPPSMFECVSEDDRYRPSDLATYFGERVRDLAARFDARNGNSEHTDGIETIRGYTRGEI